MSEVIAKIGRYDWATWLMGIWRAVIGGACGSIISSFAMLGVDPVTYNFNSGFVHTLKLLGVMFFASGLVHLIIFLYTHPGPDQEK